MKNKISVVLKSNKGGSFEPIPENSKSLFADVEISIGGKKLDGVKPVVFKKGEIAKMKSNLRKKDKQNLKRI